jgi:hypothetical protein
VDSLVSFGDAQRGDADQLERALNDLYRRLGMARNQGLPSSALPEYVRLKKALDEFDLSSPESPKSKAAFEEVGAVIENMIDKTKEQPGSGAVLEEMRLKLSRFWPKLGPLE